MGKLNKIKPPTFNEEKILWSKGYTVIGVDEVGRGAFAGPVVTAGVVFNPSIFEQELPEEFYEIHDSKLLSPFKRVLLATLIKKYCLFHAISTVNVQIINRLGIGKATKIAFRKSISELLKKLKDKPTSPNILISSYPNIFVLVDGFHIQYVRGIGIKNQKAIIKGDQKSITIAASSIIAKVYRDSLMEKLDKEYPEYCFAIHKGYGTKLHQETIKKHGLSKIHRTSFNYSLGAVP